MNFDRNTIFIAIRFIAEFINSIYGIIIFPLILIHLGPEAYGISAQIGTINGFMIPLATLGLGFAVIRLISGNTDRIFISKYFFTVLLITGFAGVILTTIVIIFAPFLNSLIIKVIWATPVLQLAAFLIVLTALELCLNDFFRARLRILSYSLIQIFQVVTNFTGTYLLLMNGGNLFDIILLTIITKLLSILLMVGYFSKKEFTVSSGYMQHNEIADMVNFGIPIVTMQVGCWLMNFGNRAVIGLFMTIRDVGIYSASYSIAVILVSLAAPFWGPLYPMMATAFNNNDLKELTNVCRNYMNYYLFFSLPALCGLIVVAPSLLQIMSQNQFEISMFFFSLIALSIFIDQFTANAHYIVYLHNEPKFIRNVILLSGFINIILALVLVPFFGIIGAGFATLIAFALLDTLLFIRIMKYGYNIQEFYDLMTIKKIIFSALVMSVTVYLCLAFVTPSVSTLLTIICAGIGIYFLMLWILQGFNIHRVIELWGK